MSVPAPSLQAVQSVLASRIPLYQWRKPIYQTVMLQSLASIWGKHKSVLDIGGGTGVIAQAIQEIFSVDRVLSVDVADRFLSSLSVSTQTYDGKTLPAADASFDCAVLNNMIHHVPPSDRPALLRECKRAAGNGPLYIKDHLATSALDRARLAVLDWIGNAPFKGMVEAEYLTAADWTALREGAGYRQAAIVSGKYRSGPMALAFPNRLEIVMKWVPV